MNFCYFSPFCQESERLGGWGQGVGERRKERVLVLSVCFNLCFAPVCAHLGLFYLRACSGCEERFPALTSVFRLPAEEISPVSLLVHTLGAGPLKYQLLVKTVRK